MKNISAALLLLLLGSQAQAAVINVGGACSLQDAIRSANNDNATGGCTTGSGNDSIITPDTYPVVIIESLPTINSDMTISTQTENGLLVIDGINQHRIFNVFGQNTELTLTLSLIHI